MIRKVIDIVLTVNLIVVVGYIAYLWHEGILVINFNQQHEVVTVKQDVYEIFTVTLQQEVNRELGQPIEGYEPFMFMQVFPGLVKTDFDGVEASIGVYRIENGQLIHDLGEGRLIHSAAASVTRRGMRTLLDNVATRLDIDLKHDGTITEIMNAISD